VIDFIAAGRDPKRQRRCRPIEAERPAKKMLNRNRIVETKASQAIGLLHILPMYMWHDQVNRDVSGRETTERILQCAFD
jgi:hypothetical protein